MVPIPVYGLVPHGGGTHPQAVLAVQCAVDHHRLPGFRMGRGSDDLIEFALEMPVKAGFDIHNSTFLKKRAGEFLRRAMSY